jgi:hypothetical protein
MFQKAGYSNMKLTPLVTSKFPRPPTH